MQQLRDMNNQTKRKTIFTLVISVVIAGLLLLTAFLNISTYKNNYYDIMAENNYSILDSIVSKIEYGVKYGKSINNYYDIDEIFDEVNQYCEIENYFIYDQKGKCLYGTESISDISDKIEELSKEKGDYIKWRERDNQYILTKIMKNNKMIAVAGISYDTSFGEDNTIAYIYRSVGIITIAVILLFFLLFFKVPHEFALKKILFMVIPVVVMMNIIFGVFAYFVFKDGYNKITDRTATVFLDKTQCDIEDIVSKGVNYDEIYKADEYYKTIVKNNDLIESIEICDKAKYQSRTLAKDSKGVARYLNLKISKKYISGKMNELIVRIAVTTITSLMIAVEILIFIIDVLLSDTKRKRGIIARDGKYNIQTIGIVRGLSFFFAAFRYMSIAFMAIVLAEIYKPVFIFGIGIPYQILMGIPLSAQIFISMITSYMSGSLITKLNWKPVALGGIIAMAAGNLCSSYATEPMGFILSQMLVGIGLGFAKTAIDIYAVVASSKEDMSVYTSSANSSIIVGFSCSASIGSVIASIFGFQGAYVVMTLMGIVVFILVYIFGQNISCEPKEEDVINEDVKAGFDFGFLRYILFIIIPYFFVMMFVDYFFPVYSNSHGLSTDNIGYVMLLYGIATSYVGAVICGKLTTGKKTSKIMSVIMIIIAASILIFMVSDYLIFAILVVVIIGVADGIMPSMQFDYLYRLPLSKKVGFSKTVGIEGFFSSAIGAVAPIVFGVVMMYGNGGLMIVSVFIIICSVFFYWFDKIRKEQGA